MVSEDSLPIPRLHAPSQELLSDIRRFIESAYKKEPGKPAHSGWFHHPEPLTEEEPEEPAAESVEEAVSMAHSTFAESVLEEIDRHGMTDVDCYKKANLDRKLFSKLRSDRDYRPSKLTAVRLALALELPLRQTQKLLGKAGYALSDSSTADIIIQFFIRRQNFDLFEINDALCSFDQPPL